MLTGTLAFRLFVFVVPYAFVLLPISGSAADLTKESGQAASAAGA